MKHHDAVAPRRAQFRRGAAALTLLAVTGGMGLTGASAAGAAVPDGTACAPAEGLSGCRLFDAARDAQAFKVPSGVTRLNVRVWGEGGAGGSLAKGGAGGFVGGTLKVTPGETLSLAVAGPRFGDALGGEAGSVGAERGGNSSAIRTSGGTPLVVAGGGGGGGGDRADDQAGAAGGESGQDASGKDRGGKGATGAKGGAGTGKGTAGADHAKGGAGGAGGAGRYGGGGGGAGYAGGGGGTGADSGTFPGGDSTTSEGTAAEGTTGSGGGGSSYAEPARVDDARLVAGKGAAAPEKTDPYWAPSAGPAGSGVAEGGANATGGPGRIVLQWQSSPTVDRLTQVSGTGQITQPGGSVDPLAVVARDKDGKPVADTSVTFTIEDPDGLKPAFHPTGGPDDDQSVVSTDAQGRAQSPWIGLGSEKEGEFTVRAKTQGVSTVFTVRVKESPYAVSVADGDEQQAEQGQDFAEALRARVVESGKAAPAGTEVVFRVEDGGEGAPRFGGEDQVVRVKTDAMGRATAPTLTAGEGTGIYTVAASAGDAMAQFAVEVVPGDGSDEPGPGDGSASPSPSPSTDPSPSADPSPSPGASDSGTTGGTGTTTGGTSTNGGSLASTGAGNVGLLLAAAAGLATAGFAAFRLAPRLRLRSRD
ncbi:hypothetical protein [Streptomyces sp. NPDC008137]|uniref:hypothetical protein n=1 Tax=Streptomyces sp. NPDC008137 TaxID=3364813 RepID=UPI0036EF9B54